MSLARRSDSKVVVVVDADAVAPTAAATSGNCKMAVHCGCTKMPCKPKFVVRGSAVRGKASFVFSEGAVDAESQRSVVVVVVDVVVALLGR